MSKADPANTLKTLVLGIGIILACVAIAAAAQAGDLNVNWQHPTTNTDGTPIPTSGDGALTGTRVEYGECDGTSWGTTEGDVLVPYPANSTVIQNVSPGTWCVRGFSRNTYGQESVASNTAFSVIEVPVPNPPTLVTVESVAYEIKLHPVTQVASLGRRVGAIAYGVPCGETAMVETRGGAYYPVPNDKVSFSKEPKSSIVVTRCALL